MRIGLFGGSFNPPHCHHLKIARAVQNKLKLDEIWFIPVFRPVHKPDRELLPFSLRWKMLKEILREEPGFIPVDLEKTLGGASYTYRLVKHLQKERPHDRFWLVIGSDSLLDLPNWRHFPKLISHISLAVVARPGFFPGFTLPIPAQIEEVPLEEDAISSSTIRQHLALGRLRHLPVPPRLFPILIRENVLDCCGKTYQRWFKVIRDFARKSPGGLRRHMEEVADEAAVFAAELGEDPRDGFTAGLAHDLFRGLPDQTIRSFLRRRPQKLRRLEQETPMLAHGAAAAAFLESLTPPVPPRIKRAVRGHTFPRTGAAPLGQALILADALAPGRTSSTWRRLRATALPAREKYELVRREKHQRAAHKRQEQIQSQDQAA